MNEPSDNLPRDEWIDSWLDGSLSPDQQSLLAEWLAADPKRMQTFVEANIREQMLVDASRGLLVSEEAHGLTLKPRTIGQGPSSRILVITLSLVATLILALVLIPKGDRGGQKVDPFVTVAMLKDSGSQWHVGDRLADETIELRRGWIRLLFDDGVEVTLQGPARYELIGPGRTKFHAGLLTATVPPGAEGFQVSTPAAEVVDWGTVFGIALADEGSTLVSVFDGEVQVKPANSEDKQNVFEGQSIRINRGDEIQPTDFNSGEFEKVWPLASGITGSSGAFRFAKPWPRPMGMMQSDSDIFVLPEGYAKSLDQPLRVNVSTPGVYDSIAALKSELIPAGTRVQCFLLQFRPLGDPNVGEASQAAIKPDDIKRIVGEITFDRPVLGLIVTGADLRLSDGLFSERGGQVPQKGRSLELGGTPRDDVVTFSEDRRTIKLDLAAFGLFCDQVRVIVDQPLSK